MKTPPLPPPKKLSKEEALAEQEGFHRFNLRKSLRIIGRAGTHPTATNRPTGGRSYAL